MKGPGAFRHPRPSPQQPVSPLPAPRTRSCAKGSCPAAKQQPPAATDRQIDRLVYELYGLTDAEIAIVEAATERP